MNLDPTMKALIDRAAERRPNALAESLNLPHVPEWYFTVRDDDVVPFCGCFVGSLAIALAMEDGDRIEGPEFVGHGDEEACLWFKQDVPSLYVSGKLRLNREVVMEAANWCVIDTRDRAAVTYARRVLRQRVGA